MTTKRPAPPTPALMSLQDVASLLRVSQRTIRRMHDRAEIPPPVRLPGGRLLRWRAEAIYTWLDGLEG